MRASLHASAVSLRKEGYSYSEIADLLPETVSKSTLSSWLSKIELSKNQLKQQKVRSNIKLAAARARALASKAQIHSAYLESVEERNPNIQDLLVTDSVAKAVLGMLYLAEGSKNSGKSLSLGNTDAQIIQFYLTLLRRLYKVDESKFRCTVMARADQDLEELDRFWSNVTRIPLTQFYAARVDERTYGKPTKKADYKGVCRIDYFSADLLYEIMSIGRKLVAPPVK